MALFKSVALDKIVIEYCKWKVLMKRNVLIHWPWTFISLKKWSDRIPQAARGMTALPTNPSLHLVWAQEIGSLCPHLGTSICPPLPGALGSQRLSVWGFLWCRKGDLADFPSRKSWPSRSFWNFPSAQHPSHVRKPTSCIKSVASGSWWIAWVSPAAVVWVGRAGKPPEVGSNEGRGV